MRVQSKASGESVERRNAIRETWLPRAQATTGVAAKFVVGNPATEEGRSTLMEEVHQHAGEFMLVDVDDVRFETSSMWSRAVT
jgi:Galactosyltransferase